MARGCTWLFHRLRTWGALPRSARPHPLCGEVTDQSSVPWINREPELPRLTVVDRMFQTNTLTRNFKSWVTFKKKKKSVKPRRAKIGWEPSVGSRPERPPSTWGLSPAGIRLLRVLRALEDRQGARGARWNLQTAEDRDASEDPARGWGVVLAPPRVGWGCSQASHHSVLQKAASLGREIRWSRVASKLQKSGEMQRTPRPPKYGDHVSNIIRQNETE